MAHNNFLTQLDDKSCQIKEQSISVKFDNTAKMSLE